MNPTITFQALMLYFFATNVYPYAVAEGGQTWAEALGWTVGAAPVLLGITLGAVHAVYMKKGSIRQVGRAELTMTVSCSLQHVYNKSIQTHTK